MQEELNSEYNNRMIEAFVGKPKVTLWYQLSFAKFNVHGVDTMRWNWSWWACFTGFLFLLYRKQYIPALVLFCFSTAIGFIPFGFLISMVLSGGYATYFIYKGYKTKLSEIEAVISDEDERVETMREVGGVHQWVVWVYGIFTAVMFLSIIVLLLPVALA